MSAQIISVDSLPISARPEMVRPLSTPEHTGFDDIEAHGLRAAKGITAGILLSVPAWLVVGLLCYFIF